MTHVYNGGTSLSVDPLHLTVSGGVTTLIDAGSAGPGNFAGFRAHVCRSMRPGVTMAPAQSFTVAASAASPSPTAATLPSEKATSVTRWR